MYELKQISINYQYHMYVLLCVFVRVLVDDIKLVWNYVLIQSILTNVQIYKT